MTNYVSFSLFGKDPFYCLGAIENIKLCPIIYSGWSPVVYVDNQVPSYVCKELMDGGALVIQGGDYLSRNKRAWRFAAVLISDAERVIFRDTDSRINLREKACVQKWMNSHKTLHIMRDHPYHANWIMAGMWGVDASIGREFVEKVLITAQGREVGEDQYLIARMLYKHLRKETLVHDSFFRREKWAEPFPSPRENGQFVGERINQEGKPEVSMRDMLIRYEKSRVLRFQLRAQDYRRTRTEQKLVYEESE